MSIYTQSASHVLETSPLFFRQDLPHNASVTAWQNQPEIELTFRKHKYNITITADQVEQHLHDLKRNLNAYLNARGNVGKESLSIRGYGNMTLRFNGRNEGVCLEDYFCLVSSEKEYTYYAAALRKARDIASSH
jgi:hypothetical protein